MPQIFSQQPKLLQTEPSSPSPADTEAALNKPVAVIPSPLVIQVEKKMKDKVLLSGAHYLLVFILYVIVVLVPSF